MANQKPYVALACVCEHVLVERDGVSSLIRVVDTYTLEMPPPLPDGVSAGVDLTAVVSLKSGDITGSYEVGLVLRAPNGTVGKPQKWDVILNGGEHGANLVMKFELRSPVLGLYWFDVLWGDDVLTSIPFRLKPKSPTAIEDSPKTN